MLIYYILVNLSKTHRIYINPVLHFLQFFRIIIHRNCVREQYILSLPLVVGFFTLQEKQLFQKQERWGFSYGKRNGTRSGRKSQSAMLKKLVQQALISVGTGAILLLGFIVFNIEMSNVYSTQLDTTMALNQYRLGSKTLTFEVQSYVVTGKQEYYNAYMKELNEDKNREKAIEVLQTCGLTASEWESLDQIASMSENLVPLEQKAIAFVQNGDLISAQSCVFSAEYENTVEQINHMTDSTIQTILTRKDESCSMFKLLQIIVEILFWRFFYLCCSSASKNHTVFQ